MVSVKRAGKQTKAYWRAEQRRREKWLAEKPVTKDATGMRRVPDRERANTRLRHRLD